MTKQLRALLDRASTYLVENEMNTSIVKVSIFSWIALVIVLLLLFCGSQITIRAVNQEGINENVEIWKILFIKKYKISN